jgi:hypothetical protein
MPVAQFYLLFQRQQPQHQQKHQTPSQTMQQRWLTQTLNGDAEIGRESNADMFFK